MKKGFAEKATVPEGRVERVRFAEIRGPKLPFACKQDSDEPEPLASGTEDYVSTAYPNAVVTDLRTDVSMRDVLDYGGELNTDSLSIKVGDW